MGLKVVDWNLIGLPALESLSTMQKLLGVKSICKRIPNAAVYLNQNTSSEKKIQEKPIKIVYRDDQSCTLAHAATPQMSNHDKRNPNQQNKSNNI